MSPRLKNNLGLLAVLALYVIFGVIMIADRRGGEEERPGVVCDGTTVAGVELQWPGKRTCVRVLDLGGYRLAVAWHSDSISLVQLRGLPESEEDVRTQPEYLPYQVWTNAGVVATSYWSKPISTEEWAGRLVHVQRYCGATGVLYHAIREER